MPGPPATLPGLVFFGAVGFALSVYLWGTVTAVFLLILLVQFWFLKGYHGNEAREKRLIGAMRKSMDEAGNSQLDKTLSMEKGSPDVWLPYLGLTLASAIVMVAVNVLVGALFFPILIYLGFKMKDRSDLYDKLEGSAEGTLVADQH